MRTLIQRRRGRTTRHAHRDLDGMLEDSNANGRMTRLKWWPMS